MAGGMYRGRSGPSLADRAASSGVGPEPSYEREPEGSSSEPPPPARFVPPPPPADRPGRPPRGPGDHTDPPGRHCWVRDPPGAPGSWPGLLVEWRQRADGWQGRVAYTVAGPHGPVLIEGWLPADRLAQG